MTISGDNKDTELFVNLLVPNQRRIQAFILMLVPNINDAEDIYQEALSEMWKKFDTFQAGTDFVAWAMTVAKYKVLTFRRKSQNSKMQFNSKIYEILESAASSKISSLQEHLDVLKKCVRKLPEKEMFLLKLRYENDMTFQKISLRTGKTPPSIHRVMSTIHSKLALCIRRTLRLEEIA
ncbi:MAG: sigma-70 family RNA polymerase sigma factor [Anaerohalosphaera sp.]|nr:sigma-70 family RNA polymerase sigma factor [Anaerohalosphaera sp.]